MNRNIVNLSAAVVIGVIAAEMIIRKSPVGKMLGLA
jgi:hypothetical protein